MRQKENHAALGTEAIEETSALTLEPFGMPMCCNSKTDSTSPAETIHNTHTRAHVAAEDGPIPKALKIKWGG